MDLPGWFPKSWNGVGMDVLGTTLTMSVVVAGFVGWVKDLPRSRFMQSVVAAMIMSPGTAIFCLKQWDLEPHWAWLIGTLVGICALSFLASASTRAPLAMDVAISAGVEAARRILHREEPPPEPDKKEKP